MLRIVFVFLASSLFAQFSITKNVGEKIKCEHQESIPGFIGADANGYYTISSAKLNEDTDECLIEYFNFEGKSLAKNFVKLSYGEQTTHIEHAVLKGDRIQLITSLFDKKKFKETIIYETMDAKTFSLNDDVKIIKNITTRTKLTLELFHSDDMEKFFLVYNDGFVNYNRPIRDLGIVVWDKDLNEIGSGEVTVPEEKLKILSIKPFANGDVFVTARAKNGKGPDAHLLYTFLHDKKVITKTVFENTPRKVLDVSVSQTDSNRPLIVGLYSDSDPAVKDPKDAVKGYFFQEYDLTSQKLLQARYYGLTIKNKGYTLIKEAKPSGEIEHLKIEKIIPAGDTFYIVAQTQFITSKQTTAYGSMVAFKTDKLGKLQSAEVINKALGYDTLGRPGVWLVNNTLTILYGDMFENLGKGPTDDYNVQGLQSLFLAQVLNGTVKRDCVLRHNEFEFDLEVGLSFRAAEKILVLYGIQNHGSSMQSAVITLQ